LLKRLINSGFATRDHPTRTILLQLEETIKEWLQLRGSCGNVKW